MIFPKEVPKVGAYGPFYPNFSLAAASQTWSFSNFACRIQIITIIISRQMKCKTYGNFKSFLNLKVLYCTPNLFCPFDHLPTVTTQSTYLNCLYSLTLNLT